MVIRKHRPSPMGLVWFAFIAAPLVASSGDDPEGEAVLLAGQEEQEAVVAEEADPKTRFYSVEIGGGLSRGYTSGLLSRFRVWEPGKYAVTVDFGTQHGFGETDLSLGGTYLQEFGGGATLTVGAAAGKSIFFPELLWGVSFAKPVHDLGLSGGYLRRQWDDGGYSNEVSGGVNRWFAHWIVGGYVRYHWGEPNRFRSIGGGVGVSYYVWRDYTVGVGFDIGDELYRESLFGLKPKGFNIGYSRWLSESSGINVRFDQGWSTFVGRITGVSASWFKEW